MKKVLAFLCSLFSAALLFAQEETSYPRHEVFASYACAPLHSFARPGNFPGSSIVGAGTVYSTSEERFSGTFNAGYLYHVSRPLAIGIAYTRSSMDGKVVLGSSEPMADYSNICHTVMLTGKYSWLHVGQFSFYSRVAAGLTFQRGKLENDSDPYVQSDFASVDLKGGKTFAWQVAPLGMEWHFVSYLAVFAEGGVGVSGSGMVGVKAFF